MLAVRCAVCASDAQPAAAELRPLTRQYIRLARAVARGAAGFELVSDFVEAVKIARARYRLAFDPGAFDAAVVIVLRGKGAPCITTC